GGGITQVQPMAANGVGAPLHEGGLRLDVNLGTVAADVILRKPDFPTYIDNGNYINALGKIQASGVSLSLSVYAVGGNFAQAVLAGGYGLGIDLNGITFQGGIQLDLTEFDCRYNLGNSGGYQWANDEHGFCYVASNHTETCGNGAACGGTGTSTNP